MKIAYIAAGAAGMYCGSCLHDNTLAAALIKKGQEVALIPTYTPLRTDESDVSIDTVFFGGINIYLQQKFSLFRHTPRFLDKLFDGPKLLNWVSRKSSMNNARELGELALATLRGEEGNLRKEIVRLSAWLRDEYKPDIIQLTNSMFAGMVHQIKSDIDVPILCAMQGEDIFLEGLPEPYKSDVLALLRKRAGEIDGFIATSSYYADFMTSYLQTPAERIHVVHLGINTLDHGLIEKKTDADQFVVGYLARICPEKGLHNLIEAIALLRRKVPDTNLQFKVAGYLGKRDHHYFQECKKRVLQLGLQDIFDYRGEVDRSGKIAFLNSLDVLSVPTVYQDPKGLFMLEAMANGVPVIQPEHGAFPEMIDATGGGLVVEPNSPTALAEGLEKLHQDIELRHRLGQAGKQAIFSKFTAEHMAERTLGVYQKFL